MKVYQCIHKYPPHIPYLEKKYNVESKNLTFDELRNIILNDGYASSYVLKPALEGKHERVFFTIWDYKRLQHKWAEENGLKTEDLDEIKLAQIESFKPDVFYNHSPRYDNNFIKKLEKVKNLKKVCWDAIITEYPWLHKEYDMRLTLFEPYVRYWHSKGLNASLLTPAVPSIWSNFHCIERKIDVLFYGQMSNKFFSERNNLISKLLDWQTNRPYKVNVHLQYVNKRIPYVDIKGLRRLTKCCNSVPKIIRDYSLPPLYGIELYDTIGRSKIVVNAFTDHNGLFKDNMRNYEAIGCGALLIAQDGIFPEFLNPDEDFLTFKNAQELFEKIEFVLSMPDQGRNMAEKAHLKLTSICSKESQWDSFQKLISSL